MDDFSHLRILIVDDFEMIRVNIKNALNAIKVKLVDEAKDGKEGLEKIKSTVSTGGKYDLVFCDWNMPHMTGIQLLSEVKQNAELSKIPFVMVTSESEKAAVLEAIKLGAIDYVVKPFSLETIEKKIQKFFGKK